MFEFLNKYITMSEKCCICENLIFCIGPLTALLAARYGLKAWIKYEILVSMLIAAILVAKPRIFYDHMVIIFLIIDLS